MARHLSNNEILAAVYGLTRPAVVGPNIEDLASRLGCSSATVIRRLGPLLESGRVQSSHRFGITLTDAEMDIATVKARLRGEE